MTMTDAELRQTVGRMLDTWNGLTDAQRAEALAIAKAKADAAERRMLGR